MRARRVFAGLAVVPLLATGVQIASADDINNSIVNGAGGFAQITAGSSVDVTYWVQSEGNDGQAGCNAADGTGLSFDISVPAGGAVTATPDSLTFTACNQGNASRTVTFSSSTVGRYQIGIAHIADAGNAGRYDNLATWTLEVVAGGSTAPTDSDGDGVPDSTDNCPGESNLDQTDVDSDGRGDACDDNSYAPEIDQQAGDANGKEGTPGNPTTTGSFSDRDGNDLTLSLIDGEGDLTDNGDGSFSWSHITNDDASGTVTVQATDGEKSATQTFAWTAANVAPVISTISTEQTGACAVAVTGSFSDQGSADTHTASVNWGDSADSESLGAVFSSDGVNASHTYTSNGTFTVALTVTDDDSGADTRSASFGTKNTASAIMQPINVDGKVSTFKIGSTIPVKITVTGCDGQPVSDGITPMVGLKQLDNTAGAVVNETVDSVVPTNGKAMRYSDGVWIYNLSTKLSQFTGGALGGGSYQVTVSDGSFFGSAPTATFDLRK